MYSLELKYFGYGNNEKSTSQSFTLQTGMSWCLSSATSPAYSATSPTHHVASPQSLVHGWVPGSRHCRGRRCVVRPTSVMLPGMTAYRQTAAYIVPGFCASETVLPEHLLHLGLCSSLAASLPSSQGETPSGLPRSRVWPRGIWHHGSFWAYFLSCCSSFDQGWRLSGSGGVWMGFIAHTILVVAQP